jgi:hypothetical protein
MDQHQFTRRRFIVSVIALSGTAGAALRPDLFAVSRAWAESASPLDDSLRQAMLRMARLLFPHDALGDDVYAEILDRALSDVASGTEFAEQLEATADALARQPGDSWAELDETGQIEAMRSIELLLGDTKPGARRDLQRRGVLETRRLSGPIQRLRRLPASRRR